MRSIAAILVTGLVVAASTVPVAAADPAIVAPPEVAFDSSRVVFTDNPWIVDPHSTKVESWSRTDDGLAVNFTVGTSDCFGVHAIVEETAETVTVDLRGGTPPESVGRICILLAVFGTLDVPLQRPVGARQVLSLV